MERGALGLPIYLALAKQLEFEIPFTQAKRNLPEKPDLETFSLVHEWLDSMDLRVQVHQLRHLLQMTTLNASERAARTDPASSSETEEEQC